MFGLGRGTNYRFNNKGEHNYPLCPSAVANELTRELRWFSICCSGDCAEPEAEITRGTGRNYRIQLPPSGLPSIQRVGASYEDRETDRTQPMFPPRGKSRIWAAKGWWTRPGCVVVAGSVGFFFVEEGHWKITARAASGHSCALCPFLSYPSCIFSRSLPGSLQPQQPCLEPLKIPDP